METEAASKIWRRSSAYDMNYKWMICDGDSSAYNKIWKTYGPCESCEKFMFLDNSETEKVKMTAVGLTVGRKVRIGWRPTKMIQQTVIVFSSWTVLVMYRSALASTF